MTEDQATTKWCPFARTPQPGKFAGNRTPTGDFINSRCIGSACMAWRTRKKLTGVVITKNDGFCGLAGAQS